MIIIRKDYSGVVAGVLCSIRVITRNLGYEKCCCFGPFVSSFSFAWRCRYDYSTKVPYALSTKPVNTSGGKVELSIAPEEEVYARNIRKAILVVENGSVEEIIRSLQCDELCQEIPHNSNLVDSLINRFGDDWKSALGFFEWASSHMGCELTSFAYDKMVDLLGKMRQIDLMWDLVQKMHMRGFVSIETVAKMMRRLAGARRFRDVLKLFDDLELLGLARNTETMNLLLDTLCKEKRIDVARKSLSVLKDHILPDAYTYNIFVHGWCNANRLDEAMWTIQEMRSVGIKPSVITYSTIIQAYCNKHNFVKVYELLDEMIAEGCPPNVVTYTNIMNSLAKSKRLEEALSLVSRMKASSCKPDILFYNSLINILGRAGQLHKAFRVFDQEMRMNGVAHNLATYNTMISVFCQHDQRQNAFNVLKEMEKSSCTPDLQTYRPLFKLCLSKAVLDENFDKLLSEMIEKQFLSLDLDTYTLLIIGLCRLDNVGRATLLFDEMISREIKPRRQTYLKLLNEAEKRNMYPHVERIKTLMNQVQNS